MATPQAPDMLECPHCGRSFHRKGLPTHKKACKSKHDLAEDQALFLAEKRSRRQDPDVPPPDGTESDTRGSPSLTHAIPLPLNEPSMLVAMDPTGEAETLYPDTGNRDDASTDPCATDTLGHSGADALSVDDEGGDIRVEYHPNSGRRCKTFTLEGFEEASSKAHSTCPADPEPWAPFNTREDFEFSALVREAGMSKQLVEKLITLFQRCIDKGKESFTLSKYDDMRETMMLASEQLPKFEKETITVSYKDKPQEFDVWVRPIWSWIETMLLDKDLIQHFEWDACRMSKFDKKSNSWVRFYDEPWTGDQFWKTQSNLPPGAKPLVLIVYADKSKLSSFGTKKGYPVIMRCGNLPVKIRNGKGLGGGRVVGWLPVIEEDASESGKPDYVNFKQVVWHESFRKLLKSIRQISKGGYNIDCADDINRQLHTAILILSADYEEQSIMALIRGSMCDFPCPICLAAKDKLYDGKVYAIRTIKNMKEVYEKAQGLKTAKAKEALFKDHGLRDIKNAFWELENSDPYQALSFDRLHSSHLGLFKTHLWPIFKTKIKDSGRSVIKRVNDRASEVPRWRNLYHFPSGVMTLGFSDGSKYEDLSKISVFLLHNIFSEKSPGYLLLRVLRCYIEIDMYAGFQLHTEKTVEAGRKQVSRFYKLLQAYIKLETSMIQDEDVVLKQWDFPKVHLQSHLFDDIITKGVTRNYNTKMGESCHRPFRSDYVSSTNFRDVDEQLLRLDHIRYTITFIQTKVNILDEENKSSDTEITVLPPSSRLAPKIHLGSEKVEKVEKGVEKKEKTIGGFAAELPQDASSGFQAMLEEFLNSFYEEHQLPHSGYLQVSDSQQIWEYQFLRVNYENMVDWRFYTELLRCNESFYGYERRDCVLVKSGGKHFFARLIRLFRIMVDTKSHALAFVELYSRPSNSLRKKDKDLGLYRLRLNAKRYGIISLESIVRGALLIPDFEVSGEYLIVDTIDADMFLRMKSLIFL